MRWKVVMAVLLCCLLASALVIKINAAGLGLFNTTNLPEEVKTTTAAVNQNTGIISKLQEPVNVLIVGIDVGKFPYGARREDVGRTDTIMMAHLNPSNQTINLMSIPRDTLVEIPGQGKDKINHAYAFGGMPLTVATVELFTGVAIDYYGKFDYQTFQEIVNLLGGVEVEVTEELHHKYYDFYPGKVKMDPAQAFIYLRLRNVPTGDIARTERQQKFCIDLLKEIRKQENWGKIPRIYQIVNEYSETNISLLDALKIAGTFNSISGNDISVNIVPGTSYWYKGVSYWKPDPEQTAALVATLFETNMADSD